MDELEALYTMVFDALVMNTKYDENKAAELANPKTKHR